MNCEDQPERRGQEISSKERLPCFFLVFSTVIVLFAGGFFLRYSGGLRWDVYDASGYLAGLPRPTATSAVLAGGPAQKPAAVNPIQVGQDVYQANCAACHQPTGQGMSGQFPPVAGSDWVNGDPRVLAAMVLGGLQGPVRVAGAEYNGMMPAWKTVLNDAKIAAVLTFLRQSWGNHGSAVEEDQVKSVRAETANHAAPWKVEEVETLGKSAGKEAK
ncbi:c-type cytochrome [Methylacidimicrobium tartarophylax]|uniref:Cytochrome c-552 n=1 Tax=Methylacidimicrobium tartarophylax TaxID=1041768 RepID=A0A5E6MBF8_9BACT|nr:cytochrome c [Methylacidimicrobium tartarophylax]VVM06310.1 Cytochrome c-552 [Methylacidimicrobium tartarophylax]